MASLQRRTIYKGGGHTSLGGEDRLVWESQGKDITSPRTISPTSHRALFYDLQVLLYPSMAPPSHRTQSTHRVQSLEFFSKVFHSALLVWVSWVPGSFFLQPMC